MRAWIVSNGEINDYSFYRNYKEKADIVICADGGAKHLEGLELIPDILLGDMDSIKSETLIKYDNYKDKKIEIVKYPSNKDKTDTQIAVEYAISIGCDEIVLVGCLGNRFDHSFANVALLKLILLSGRNGKLVNENNEITLIDKAISLSREKGNIISLIPISSKVSGITTSGLKYELNNAEIEFGSSLGVSNLLSDKEASISLKSGFLLVALSKD